MSSSGYVLDAYSVGYLVGSVVCPAALAYFLGRKLFGPSGVNEVERLKHLAGVAEPGERPPSRLGEWMPYLLAAGGAVFGLVFGAGSLFAQGVGPLDQEKLESSFSNGCIEACVKGTRPQGCHYYCGCMLSDFKRRYPTVKGLRDFFQAGLDKQPAARAEYAGVANRCFKEYMVDTEATP